MDATRGRQRLNFPSPFAAILGESGAMRFAVPLAPAIAMVLAALGALMFLLMPTAVLEDLVVDSGIASLVTAAQPPLGVTAHFAIAFIVALVVGGVSWFGLFLLIGTRVVAIGRNAREDGVPILRRADAHPDAPPRRPVFANRDLGTPFLEVTADTPPPMSVADAVAYVPPVIEERDIPADLDTPLATYRGPLDPPLPAPDPLPIGRIDEPVAAPEPIIAPLPVPEPVVAVDPRRIRAVPESPAVVPPADDPAPRFASHERIETFELTPMVRSSETSAPLPSATIHDLLDRLERGVAKRKEVAEPEPAAPEAEIPAAGSLEETLGVLRQLASRVG
ncbi:hypothetical protein [Sphingomonas pruni]|uniref:hypothetical protein n=1 Tax=Sphingomonas pruni TaxID=40683 RepID=UPI000831F24D|nr:hypothetical protein [Sphingomonas pruni]